MKGLMILLVLGVGVGAAVYFYGGVADFDPSEQGRQAKAAIKPGMTWKKVIDVARKPREYRMYVPNPKTEMLPAMNMAAMPLFIASQVAGN